MSSRRTSTDASPEAQLADGRLRGRTRRLVLLVGEVAVSLRAELVARGAVITEVGTLADAFDALADAPFDVVLLNADTDGCGLDFLNAVKEGAVA